VAHTCGSAQEVETGRLKLNCWLIFFFTFFAFVARMDEDAAATAAECVREQPKRVCCRSDLGVLSSDCTRTDLLMHTDLLISM
jgi:hypothetical protein